MSVDPNNDSTIVASPVGPVGGTVSIAGGGDDILVGQSARFIAGEAHAFPGLANGDFNVLVDYSRSGGFLSGPAFILNVAIADFNGVNTTLTGFSLNSFTSGRIDGSRNLSLTAIPEPSALLLLGSGLAALGWFNRKPSR